ncbi:MAG: urease accessory protein UreD [Archangiaceae bacterium]|nr:urease accessory protein UreD [Archangiaceae bacterium]
MNDSARLVVERVLDRSVVTSARGQGPLKLLTPQNRGQGAWVYQSSLGGGFVTEDALSLEVEVGEGAVAFLSSQAAGKVYRATTSSFALTARVKPGATLVSWPDPLMAFAGSRLSQRQQFHLDEGASLVCVDSFTAGRVASGERWAMESLELRLSISSKGVSRFVDAQTLSPRHGSLEARLSGVEVMSTVVLIGPRFDPLLDPLHARITAMPLERLPTTLVTSSRWPWGLVLRLGAPTTAALVSTMRELLTEALVLALDEDPWARKW